MGEAVWPGPRRIAHRGGGTLAPENTLAAIRTAIAHGYRAVEFDVMLTADGVPVLMHDADFGRTIAGRGSVATTHSADLASRDAGGWFAERFRGEPVPRFDAVAAFCARHGVWMNVEIKPSPGRAQETGRVVGAVTASMTDGRRGSELLFSSFDADALAAARVAAPDVPRGLLVEAVSASATDAARALGCVGVHVDHRRLDGATIDRLRAAGFAVLAYTVDDPDRADELTGAGVDAIVTDRLDLIAFA